MRVIQHAAGSRRQAAQSRGKPRYLLSAAHRPLPAARFSPAYTLVELFVTVCVLIIVLGLMVSLARRVRTGSASRLSSDLLRELTVLLDEYRQRNGGQLPAITPLATDAVARIASSTTQPAQIDEAALQLSARRNNADLVRVLRQRGDLGGGGLKADVFNGLPLTLYDQVNLRDAWGSPIAYLPAQHPAIGMAPGDQPFFVSAGPDRKFLTREDNLYSYDEAVPEAANAEGRMQNAK